MRGPRGRIFVSHLARDRPNPATAEFMWSEAPQIVPVSHRGTVNQFRLGDTFARTSRSRHITPRVMALDPQSSSVGAQSRTTRYVDKMLGHFKNFIKWGLFVYKQPLLVNNATVWLYM